MNLKPLPGGARALLCVLVVALQLSLFAQNTPLTVIDFACTDGQTTLELLPLQNDVSGSTGFDLTTLSLISNPTKGTITVDNSTGSMSYDWLNTNYGLDAFSYRICNTAGLCDTNVVDVFINKDNSVYVTDDHYASLPGEAISGNVIRNDYDPEGDALTVSIIQTASYGTFSLSANGDFSYLSNGNYSGYDFVVYQLCDNHTTVNCETAKVHFYINPVVLNSEKTLVDYNSEYQLMADHTLNGNSLLDFSSKNSTPSNITATLLSTTSNGALNFNADGSFDYTPGLAYVGEDYFTFNICDNSVNKCITSKSKIVVSDNPISCGMSSPMVNDDINLINEDTQASGSLLSNDQDLVAGFYTLKTTPTVAPQNGTVTINADGTYTYSPDAGFFGSDQFNYQVCLTDPVESITNEITEQPIDKLITNFSSVSTLDITHCGTISDVNLVNLNIEHSDVSQLAVQLISPLGTTQTLMLAICSSSGTVQTSILANLDDESGVADMPCPANTNFTANPAHPLAKFDGESCCGVWKLEILNFQPGVHSGVIKNWALDIACSGHKSLGCREATATILVMPEVSAPVANEDCYPVNPGQNMTLDVLDNDFDEDFDLDNKSITIVSNGSLGNAIVNTDGSVSYLTNQPQVTDYFTYNVCDTLGQCDQAVVKVISSQVVPLDFSSFQVSKNDNEQALVRWETENEREVSHYAIERGNGISFESLGSVPANNEASNNYSFVDTETGLNGKYFYRVKSVDIDGVLKYTAAKSIVWELGNKMSIMPNPAKGNVTIHSNNEILDVQIIGFLGQTTYPNYNGASNLNLDITNLNPGRYTARVTTTTGIELLSFIKI